MLLQSCQVKTSITASQTNSGDLATPQVDLVKSYTQNYADGTIIDAAQVVFSDTRALGSSASESIDLAGALDHPIGGAISFTAIKEIIVKAPTTNTGDLRVGAAVANTFIGPFGASAVGCLVPPGGILHFRNPTAAGWPVTGGTADLLRVENLVAAAAAYDIIIIGEGTVA